MTERKLKKGSISVDTQSLFPIIKKWLYSEKDIFLRELISNSHDAIVKLDKLSSLGQFNGDVPEPLLNLKIDKKDKTLTFIDNGLGMDEDEINKYINQIAFSGAKDFLEKYEKNDTSGQIIGHFGMGFFSSFMVSSYVEIQSLSYKEKAKPVYWKCDGSTSFEIGKGDRKEIGTTIILHLNKDAEEYLDENKIKELVKKYSNYLPIEIQVNGTKINEQRSIWNENSSKLKEEDYKKLFNNLFPYETDPLFHIHFNIDYPFNLKGIIYFPKYRSDFDPTKKGRIQLYSNNVFVSDNIIDIIPSYLNLLQGIIDSPDIPLNVSRSALQSDANVIKMGKYIANKALDHLSNILEKDRKKYEEYWHDIHTFVKFGCLSDDEFNKRMSKAVLFRNISGNMQTFEEYKKNNPLLKNKILYTTDVEKQSSYIEELKKKEVDVLIFNHPLDNHFIQHSEQKNNELKFARVDSQPVDGFFNDDIDKNEENDPNKDFIDKTKKSLSDETLDIKVKNLENTKNFAILTVSEQMRRFGEMSKMMGNSIDPSQSLPSSMGNTLYLNTSHPLFEKAKKLSEDNTKENEYKNFVLKCYKIAKMQAGLLQGSELIEFTEELYNNLEKNI